MRISAPEAWGNRSFGSVERRTVRSESSINSTRMTSRPPTRMSKGASGRLEASSTLSTATILSIGPDSAAGAACPMPIKLPPADWKRPTASLRPPFWATIVFPTRAAPWLINPPDVLPTMVELRSSVVEVASMWTAAFSVWALLFATVTL